MSRVGHMFHKPLNTWNNERVHIDIFMVDLLQFYSTFHYTKIKHISVLMLKIKQGQPDQAYYNRVVKSNI